MTGRVVSLVKKKKKKKNNQSLDGVVVVASPVKENQQSPDDAVVASPVKQNQPAGKVVKENENGVRDSFLLMLAKRQGKKGYYFLLKVIFLYRQKIRIN